MRNRKERIIELLIENMAYGGQGVARLDGFVYFVRGTAPGDRIMARVYRKKKGYAEARMTELIEPSPLRIPAPCPYSGHCGGCQWQHLRYDRQLSFKKEHVQDALKRLGGLTDIPVSDALPSDRQFGYRNKMEFSFSDRRWLLPEEMDKGETDGGFALGLHVPGTFHKVIDIHACLLQHPTGNKIMQLIKRRSRDSGIPAYGQKSHLGFWRFLTLRHSEHHDQWMVNLVTSEQKPATVAPIVEDLCQSLPNVATVVNNITAKKAGIAVGEKEILLTGPGFIADHLGPYEFRISANSFFQTNTPGAERLYHKVLEFAELKGTEAVLDLYSGTGTIPIFLSSRAGSVVGMEIVESAVLDARKNCSANGIGNCRFVLGDIRESLHLLKWKPDVLIIDPPRAGMHKDVLAGVMEMRTDRIVYVSCNPATLARDLALMNRDYEIVEVQPVDMFPQTYHVEAVARLVRRT